MAKAAKRLFICLDNAGYEVSLERLKIYVALTDVKAERTGYLRIIDESGEDYFYPQAALRCGRSSSLDPAGGPASGLAVTIRAGGNV
jgi:hypothetical protein